MGLEHTDNGPGSGTQSGWNILIMDPGVGHNGAGTY